MAIHSSRDGTRLFYDDRGNGGRPLLFVHGWCCDHSHFSPQVECFSTAYRTIAVDLRGHGLSEKPAGDYAIETHAEDLAGLIDTLDLQGVVAIGHSMGGACVLELAARFPQRISAIVLLDPRPFVMPEELARMLEAVAESVEAGEMQFFRDFIGALFLPTSDPRLIRDVTELMVATPPHVIAAAGRGVARFDCLAAAARCRVPAMHIAAAQPLNPPHLISEQLPGVVNGWTVGGGHFNQLEVPGQVNLMIEAFLQRYL